MKKILLAAAALTGLSVSAFAADMPSRKAPAVAPVAAAPIWTGLYVGATAGYAFGKSSQRDQVTTYTNGVADGAYKPKGALGGVTAGYNWQSQALVYGLEGDLSFAGISGSSSVCGVGAVPLHVCGTKSDALGTVRARGGLAIDSTLIYATGGLAVARIKAYDAGFTNVAAQSGSAVRLGWTVGAGVEQKLDAHWSLKAEYLYTSFARASYFTLEGFTPEKVDMSANIVRAGVNYKF